MKEKTTEIVFVIDRSGSMSGLESDTIGGFNGMLKKQKNGKGEAYVTTVLFDDRYEVLHDHLIIDKIEEMDENQYYTRGTTALLDAMGLTIKKIENIVKHQKDSNVIMIIITDGYENASKEYYEKVRKLIEHQKSRYGWEFIFLGANIDAEDTAERFGIGRDRAANYNADKEGTLLNYEVISETVSYLRSNRAISGDWKKRIDEDFKERGNKK